MGEGCVFMFIVVINLYFATFNIQVGNKAASNWARAT